MAETAPSQPMETVWANRTALSLGAVGALIMVLVPATIWFSTIAARVDQVSQSHQSLQARVDGIVSDRNSDSTRLTKLETLFPQITEQLAEIRASLSKIETSLRR